jgi:putative FmdB family regulatory protein
MPFYEYECSNCKHYVEALQKISDEPLRKCPSCNKNALKKLVSAPVFRLKGNGWYETDFKGDGEDKRNLADRDEPVEKSEDSESKSESKSNGAKQAKPEVRSAASSSSSGSAAKKAPAKPAKVAASKARKPAARAAARRPAPKKPAAKKKAKRR